MRMRLVALLALSCACGGGALDAGDAGDGGLDAKPDHKPLHDAAIDTAAELDASFERLTPHSDIVISAMRLRAVYVTGENTPPNFDALLSWMLASTDYWSVLAQYGVGYGTEDSVTVDASTFFPPGSVVDGIVGDWAIGEGIRGLAEADGGDAANAYIVFLPADINVDSPPCGWELGYHTTTGTIPFAVVPQCGASGLTVSHEIAEMATDPIPFAGWYSEADEEPAGGEVGDLCAPGLREIDGYDVSLLWSNAAGDCAPK